MTGFGRGTAGEDARVEAEVRSVNARTLDVRVRAPEELGAHGLFVEQLVRRSITRGRVEVSLSFVCPASRRVRIDRGRARALREELDSLANDLGLEGRCTFEMLASHPALLSSDVSTPTATTVLPLVESAVGEALRALMLDRAREGRVLERELRTRARATLEVVRAIAKLTKDAPQRLRARFLERLAALAPEVERGRAELEVAILVDRMDVTEELVRAEAHLDAFLSELSTEGDVACSGRRLDFLLQEALREATTLSSKAQDATVSQRAVDVRVEVERLREQVQNVE